MLARVENECMYVCIYIYEYLPTERYLLRRKQVWIDFDPVPVPFPNARM